MKRKFLLKSGLALLVSAMTVVTASAEDYPLKVAGVQVTDANASDLTSVIGGVSGFTATGTISYDNTTKTLTLNGAKITGTTATSAITFDSNATITVTLTGDNSITYTTTTCYGLILLEGNSNADVTINGTGTLTLYDSEWASYDIFSGKNTKLTIDGTDGAKIISKSTRAIDNNNTGGILVLKKATVQTAGQIENLSLITLDNSKVTEPDGADVKKWDSGSYYIGIASSTVASQDIKIEPSASEVSVGTTFTVTVSGVETTFVVTKKNEEVAIGIGGTSDTPNQAISTSFSGSYEVPATVEYESVTYKVTSIADYAFYQCQDMTGLTFASESNVAKIGTAAFAWAGNNATSTQTLTLPASLTSLGASAFKNCKFIGGVDLSAPTALTKLNNQEFSLCSIETLTIPARFTLIATRVFAFNKLTSVTFEGENTYCNGDAFKIEDRGVESPVFNNVPHYFAYNFIEHARSKVNLHYNQTKAMQTFACALDVDFTAAKAEGLKVYVVSAIDKDNAKVTLTEVDALPAKTGAIIVGEVGKTYTLGAPASTPDAPATNYMVGTGTCQQSLSGEYVYVTETVESVEHTNFLLSDGTFGKVEEAGWIPAGKAYLRIPNSLVPAAPSGGAPALSLDFGSGTTGIEAVAQPQRTEQGTYYDLSGRRVENPTKGLYIVNGKKVIIK